MTTKENLIAVDAGCAYAKCAFFDESGAIKTAQIPALMARGFAPVGLSGAADTYEIEGEQWHVNNGAAENTQFKSYPYSSHNLALTLAALRSQNYTGDVQLATGVPVRDFYADAGINTANVQRKTSLFDKNYALAGGDLGLKINAYKVCPEAVSAVVDYVVDAAGGEQNAISGSVAVVDIGGRTTDLAVVNSDFMADSQSIKTLNLGVLDLYKALAKALQKDHGVESEIPTVLLESAARTGEITLYKGQSALDISSLVKREKAKLAERVQEEVERVFGARHLTQTLYAGGGAALFNDQLLSMHDRGVVVADEPQFANARGYLKIAEFLTD